MEKLVNVKQLSLNFNLREPKGNKCTNLYCVLKIGTTQFKFPTGFKVNPWNWNRKQQLPTITPVMTEEERMNNANVINVIYSIRFGYNEYFAYLCSESQTVTETEIKNYFITNILNNENMANVQNLQKGKSKSATKLLLKAFDIYYSEVKPNTKDSSKEIEKSKLNAFFNYCKEIGKDGKGMLSQRGINDYKTYLIKKSKELGEDGNGNKQINAKCKTLRKLINEVLAVHNNFLNEGIRKVEYVNLETPKIDGEEKKRRPLTADELQTLMNADNLTPKEKEYRDLLILECNCSYRVSDTKKLFDKTQQKKETRGNMEFLVIDTKKEGVKSVIYVNETVKTILDRYADGFSYVKFNKKYDDNYNKALKDIFKKIGLDSLETWKNSKGETQTTPLYEIISSHFARYTFINSCFDKGMSAEEIMDFSGHANEEMVKAVYKVRTTADKVDKAAKTLERINSTTTDTTDKVREYKDVLAFYGEPYKNYRDITDSEELLRMIVTKYELPLKEKGYSITLLKKMYNSTDAESRNKYEELLKTLDEISATVATE